MLGLVRGAFIRISLKPHCKFVATKEVTINRRKTGPDYAIPETRPVSRASPPCLPLTRPYAASGALKRRVALARGLWLEQGWIIYAMIEVESLQGLGRKAERERRFS